MHGHVLPSTMNTTHRQQERRPARNPTHKKTEALVGPPKSTLHLAWHTVPACLLQNSSCTLYSYDIMLLYYYMCVHENTYRTSVVYVHPAQVPSIQDLCRSQRWIATGPKGPKGSYRATAIFEGRPNFICYDIICSGRKRGGLRHSLSRARIGEEGEFTRCTAEAQITCYHTDV